MHIRFVVDPFAPCGTNKVIRRVVSDLRKIFRDITYSSEVDVTINPSPEKGTLPISKIFQKKVGMNFRGVVVYLVNANLTWKNKEVHGLSSPGKCVIGFRDVPQDCYKTWSAEVWELILHELGHSFGLIRKSRARSRVGTLGTVHCLNNCVMTEDRFEGEFSKKTMMRFQSGVPYCKDCLKCLIK